MKILVVTGNSLEEPPTNSPTRLKIDGVDNITQLGI